MSLTLNDVSYRRGAFSLEHLTLSIEKGAVTSVMGQSGSGKTTVLELLCALEQPDSGALLLDGEKAPVSKIREECGILFQYPDRQLFAPTLWEDIAFGIRRRVRDPAERRERALEMMRRVGLPEDLADSFPLTLSGGEKRKAALAGTLIRESEYLFLDEPLSGLDPESRESVMRTIESLRSGGRAVVFVTHSPSSAWRADRLIVMDSGRITYDGDPKAVLSSDDTAARYGLEATGEGHLASLLREKGIDLAPAADTGALLDDIAQLYRRRHEV